MGPYSRDWRLFKGRLLDIPVSRVGVYLRGHLFEGHLFEGTLIRGGACSRHYGTQSQC